MRAACSCAIYHLAAWHGGSLLHSGDEEILTAAHEDELVFVTGDVNTITAIVYGRLSKAKLEGPVAFVPAYALQANDVGGIARALIDLCARLPDLDPDFPVAYLEP